MQVSLNKFRNSSFPKRRALREHEPGLHLEVLLLQQKSMSFSVLLFLCSESTFFLQLKTPWQMKHPKSILGSLCKSGAAISFLPSSLLLIAAFQPLLNTCLMKQVQPMSLTQPVGWCWEETAKKTSSPVWQTPSGCQLSQAPSSLRSGSEAHFL